MKDLMFKVLCGIFGLLCMVLVVMVYKLFHPTPTTGTTIVVILEESQKDDSSEMTSTEEGCSSNPRACRWARGERNNKSVLRYTQTKKNLTTNRGAIIATINEVRNQLTLVPNKNNVSTLVYRTFVHESLLGSINFTNKNGQGIGQITLKHAKDMLKRISKRSPENYAIIAEISEIENPLALSDKDLLKELHTNLKLQVALCILTYWFKDPKFYQNAGSLEQDAQMWKQLYNTKLGKGTVEAFIASCNAYM